MDDLSFESFVNCLRSEDRFLYIGRDTSGTEFADICAKESLKSGRAVWLETEVPTVSNLYASFERIENALGLSKEKFHKKLSEYVSNPSTCELKTVKPDKYKTIALSDLPLKKHYTGDVSGSINTGCVISVDNCGLYRIQPLSDKRAVLHCYPDSDIAKELSKGADVPVTISVGASPHLLFAAAATLPGSINEIQLANYTHPFGIDFIDTEKYPVPADTQVVIQGTVSASEKHPEGPFMIHTGRYSAVADFPLLHLESVRIKEGGIYQTTVTGTPPMESAYIGSFLNSRWFTENFDKNLFKD